MRISLTKLGINIGIIVLSVISIGIIFLSCINILNNKNNKIVGVEFRDNKWIEIPVKIGNLYTFGVFDTGANICAIDKSIINKLDVYILPFNFMQINKRSWNPLCIIREVEIGGATFKNVLAVIIDLKSKGKIFEFSNDDLIIGTPIINKLCWHFNFKDNILYLLKSRECHYLDRFENSISYKGSLTYKTNIKIDEYVYVVNIDFGYTESLELPIFFANNTYGVGVSEINKSDIHGKYSIESIVKKHDLILGNDTLNGVIVEYTNRDKKFLGIDVFSRYDEILIDPFKKTIFLDK